MQEDYGRLVSKLIWEVSQKPILYDPQHPTYKDNHERMKAWQSVAEKINMPVPNCQIKWGTLRRCLANARKRQKRRQMVGSKYIKKWRYQDEMAFLLPFIDQREVDCAYISQPKKPKLSYSGGGGTGSGGSGGEDSINRSHELYISEEYEHSDVEETELKPNAENLQQYLVDNTSNDHSEAHSYHPERSKSNTSSVAYNKSLEELYEEEDEVVLERYDADKNWSHVGTNVKQRYSSSSVAAEDLSYLATLDEMDTFFLSMSKTLKKLPKIDQIKVRCQVYNTVTQAEINWLEKTASGRESGSSTAVANEETEILNIT